jgi:hypothetical protein
MITPSESIEPLRGLSNCTGCIAGVPTADGRVGVGRGSVGGSRDGGGVVMGFTAIRAIRKILLIF